MCLSTDLIGREVPRRLRASVIRFHERLWWIRTGTPRGMGLSGFAAAVEMGSFVCPGNLWPDVCFSRGLDKSQMREVCELLFIHNSLFSNYCRVKTQKFLRFSESKAPHMSKPTKTLRLYLQGNRNGYTNIHALEKHNSPPVTVFQG